MGEMLNEYKILVGKPEGMRLVGDLNVNARIILKRTLKDQYMRMWTGFIWFRSEINGRLLCSRY
jgi:hypothetical protein